MAKKMTLKERAKEWLRKTWPAPSYLDANRMVNAWLAGYRANRLTKAERAVVKAVAAYVAELHRYGCASTGKILDAYDAYDRAKGGAR
ncbi:MAG: hypothetical protein ING29_13200 [Azospirillum sp.]|nr:hypothetical protein [Azospirillum sp.]